ncbi:hypothetical protein FWD07_01865 [Candidatus Saccharibacteria bacterium]|nr:hypothetical protein [Candidatus Saccharibacteria bacterium]
MSGDREVGRAMGVILYNLMVRVVAYGGVFAVCFWVFELGWVLSVLAALVVGSLIVKIWFTLSVIGGIAGDSDYEKKKQREAQKKNLLKK